MRVPSYEDYIKVYHWHGMEKGDFLTEKKNPEDVRACFRQVADLARYRCLFNESLPEELLQPLRAYHAGEKEFVEHFAQIDTQLFFLSDFLDYIKLTREKSES